MVDVFLKAGREFSVAHGHPWVFSGAIASTEGGEPVSGETVRVFSAKREQLAVGAWSPASQIRIRIWKTGANAEWNAESVAERVRNAVSARARFLVDGRTDSFRVLNAEGDGLPGVVADRYGKWLVCQFTTVGAEKWKNCITDALMAAMPDCLGAWERSDGESRKRDGLDSSCGLLAGQEPPELIEINENSVRYLVDVRKGHKTGFYLDQRDNREIVARHAFGRTVLNAFCYTGGFGVAALAAGADAVTNVDLSEDALKLARKNSELNSMCQSGQTEFVQEDVFKALRRFRDEGRTFDMVVLDPPKFASSKSALMKAARGYKDINILGMKLLRPGGILATFSCSELMERDLFRKVVTEAAFDAHCDMAILSNLQQGEDHPEGLAFPQGLYLKGLLLRKN